MFKIAFKTTAVQLFHNLRGLTLVLTVLVLALSFLGINGLEVPIWGGYFTLYAVKYINRYEDRICYILPGFDGQYGRFLKYKYCSIMLMNLFILALFYLISYLFLNWEPESKWIFWNLFYFYMMLMGVYGAFVGEYKSLSHRMQICYSVNMTGMLFFMIVPALLCLFTIGDWGRNGSIMISIGILISLITLLYEERQILAAVNAEEYHPQKGDGR